MSEANILLKVAYDGSGFHGWQRQPAQRTVQGVLEEAIGSLCNTPVRIEGTSRTDAGVHALGQRATLRGDFGIPTNRIPVAANNLLRDITVLGAEEKEEGFHARYSAVAKTYIYRFAVAPPIPVFLKNYACLLAEGPNTDRMNDAAKRLRGTYDFACFQAAGGVLRETTVRTIFGAEVRKAKEKDLAGNEYDIVEIEVTGDGFLYHMVRIIAGTLASIGSGHIAPDEIEGVIASRDRKRAGPTAPPQGLYLKEVFYDKAGA